MILRNYLLFAFLISFFSVSAQNFERGQVKNFFSPVTITSDKGDNQIEIRTQIEYLNGKLFYTVWPEKETKSNINHRIENASIYFTRDYLLIKDQELGKKWIFMIRGVKSSEERVRGAKVIPIIGLRERVATANSSPTPNCHCIAKEKSYDCISGGEGAISAGIGREEGSEKINVFIRCSEGYVPCCN